MGSYLPVSVFALILDGPTWPIRLCMKTGEALLHRPWGTWVLVLVQSCRPLCDKRRTQVYSPALWTAVHLDMYRKRVTAWALTA